MHPETVEALAVVLEGYKNNNLTDIRENLSADLPQQLKVPQCNSYWVHVHGGVFAARGKCLCRRAVFGFYNGGGGGGALEAIPLVPLPAGSGAEPRPKSNLMHFYPQNIPS